MLVVLDNWAPAVVSVVIDSKFSFASLEYLTGLRILVDFDPSAISLYSLYNFCLELDLPGRVYVVY